MLMYGVSSQVDFNGSVALGGFADRVGSAAREGGGLEIAGLGVVGDEPWQLFSVDALYAGDLVSMSGAADAHRVLCASHTHYAPMLDGTKERLGRRSVHALMQYQKALSSPRNLQFEWDGIALYQSASDVPIYRRFDTPSHFLSRWLTRRAGFYPNSSQPLDRSVSIFVLSSAGRPVACLVHHACHPVSRANRDCLSPDFVGALRSAVRLRFSVDICLFLQGCAGDVRPNIATRRSRWLPRFILNWRFKAQPEVADEQAVDASYTEAVDRARLVWSEPVGTSGIGLRKHVTSLADGQRVPFSVLAPSRRVAFVFLPFELSHRFQLEMNHLCASSRLPGLQVWLVSCCDHARGYLPYPDQLAAGGYEVCSSNDYMGLVQPLRAPSSFCRELLNAVVEQLPT